MKIKRLTNAGIDYLKINKDVFAPHFLNDETNEWVVNHLTEEGYLVDSGIECEDFTFDLTLDDQGKYGASDLTNIKRVYGALKNKLPVTLAADKGFWGGFCLTYGWEYIRFRQKSRLTMKKPTKNSTEKPTQKTKKKDMQEELLLQFVRYNHGVKRGLFVNAISRLYWIGRLVEDETNSAPFWAVQSKLRDAFPSMAMLCSSYECLSNKELCLGVFEALDQYAKTGKELGREDYVAAFIFVDRLGGTMLIDSYSRAEIKALVLEQLKIKGGEIDATIS